METKNITHNTNEQPYGFIYITTNMVNGKKYLGQRHFDDQNKWKRYLGSGKVFQKALKKYGTANFKRNIICFCYSKEELNKAEYELSVFLDVVENRDWYNSVYGGGTTTGWHTPDEVKQKLSDAHKGENAYWYGKKMSQEVREKMSEAQLGEKNHFYGKRHSEAAKLKMSEAKKGIKSTRIRPVVQLTNNGVFIKEWAYIKQASDELGILATHISACCKHKQKSTGGFNWVYAEEYYTSVMHNT